MKLEFVMDEARARFDKYILRENFIKFLSEGKGNHWFVKSFEKWAAYHIVHALFKTDEICEWYKYGINDTHIETLGKRLLREFDLV